MLEKWPSRFVPDTVFSELCDRLCDQYAFLLVNETYDTEIPNYKL